MSDSEGENFDFDDAYSDASEDYAPAPKKAPAKAKAAKSVTTAKSKASGSKAAPKAKAAAGKKKPLAEHDENAEESAMEVDEQEDDVAELPGASSSKNGKKKTASEMYQKLTQLEHILKRPDSYIGSVETITQPMWTYDADTKRMVHRDVKYVPGFFKIVDEILVNAADNKINDPSMDTIKVTIDVEENTISVYNNGRGIPIEIHSREKIYIPELIFGHLLSSSNYDDDEKKLTGGRNGYGAKLANIYSLEFTIETADKNTGQKYKQTWTNNMGACGKAKITKNAKGEEWTRVTFKPDLKRFGMDRIDEDTAGLLRKRVYDMAGTVRNVKVLLNDERLKIKNFKQYIEMYINSASAEASENSGGAAQPKQTIIYEQISPRWEVGFAASEGTFMHVSFANSISTSKGGTHVNLIADQIAKGLIAAIGKKNKAATVKAPQIKNHLWIFVNSLIENPTFDSQTKETLTLPASKFGTKPVLSEDFLKKVAKSSVVENVLNWAKFKADQQSKKTDGTKRSRLTGLPKLSDANNAGTKNAKNCTLILTEGDSAKALAVAGLAVVGRDDYGVFPLRGKMLNVREAKHDQIMKNEEVQNIKKIMGFQHNKDYTDVSSLRYGRLMIMTDQDHDGSHIKGLLINYLDHFYPSLLKVPEFLVEFVTPIVRVTKGKQKKDFFTIPEYEQWAEETPDSARWDAKYFKGLGTSNDADARQYFSNMAKHLIPFAPTQEGDKELIDLAFSKKKADDRKEWLRQFKPGTYLDHRLEEIPYSEFINKELILFSMADNVRSIPSVADGLKPGQRKVIWACFKRKLKKEIKVAQLVGYVSEHAAYHHGEASLLQTIVNLAQDFVGSNNINLLSPNGQYGTRDQGGKDHASPRYIHTLPTPLARTIFVTSDDALLNSQTEENKVIEPEWYMPVVPMVLVNGAEGIGTGWSTNIPCYNPIDIVANIRRLMNDEEVAPMHPWWRGFKGEIKLVSRNKYDVFGAIEKVDDSTVRITELPIHRWTQGYKAELEAMMTGENKESSIKNYQEHHANEDVNFLIQMDPKELIKAEEKGLLEYFKLSSKINTTNMIAFDFDGKIKRYDSPEAMLEDFYPMRLTYYQKRKDYLANELQTVFERLSEQARFVQMIIERKLSVSGRKKADIVVDLKAHKFRPFPKKKKKKGPVEDEEAEQELEEVQEEEDQTGTTTDYDYLLSMPIWNLTKEKIDKLRQQAADQEAQLLVMLKKTPKEMWNEDLEKFLEEWAKAEEEHKLKIYAASGGNKKKRKQQTFKTRKSLGKSRDNDSDDDFKPIKAPRKPVAPAVAKPAAAPKPTVKKEEKEIAVTEAKTKRAGGSKAAGKAKKVESDDDDIVASGSKGGDDDGWGGDDDLKVVEKRNAPPKRRAAAVKKVIKDESDEDEDMDDMYGDDSEDERPKPKATARKVSATVPKAAAKGKAKAKEDDPIEIDSDDDDPPAATSKSKAKAPAKPAKRKSLENESDNDSDELEISKPAKKTKLTDFFSKTSPTGSGGSAGSSGSSQTKAATKGKEKEKSAKPAKISKSMKPASPPKAKTGPPKVIDSDSDEMDYDALPKPPSRPARAATTKKSQYIDVSEDDEGEGDSMFVDDDD
ncbi:type II DNA topoisomerase [Dendrothele bispora CBS 962.96]|uniref:DNA topoisomerase 2 n=1 Tax=Dendrothele bispora (strain CBS 962.96) TaxID=1314807 RepID=A0A4S8LJW2_DENBC|nr:type II DNA topoisomerase [Dendrothele bispora CBS 962.96]